MKNKKSQDAILSALDSLPKAAEAYEHRIRADEQEKLLKWVIEASSDTGFSESSGRSLVASALAHSS